MYWKISGLTKEMSRILGEDVSVKTVERWFRNLEKEGVHYITRSEETGDRVFDELDLNIALFIKDKRSDNWMMAAIFEEIKGKFETRPYPIENEIGNMKSQEMNKEELIIDLKTAFAEVAAAELDQLKIHFENQFKELPKPKDWREKKFQEMVLRKRIEYQLEKEALFIWNSKPLKDRQKRSGLFKKAEDWEKRNLFIKDYVYEHYEERLRKELIDWDN